MASAWPAPKALEGVKSKKRAIFRVEAVSKDTRGPDGDRDAPSVLHSEVVLTLESRIVALRDSGHALLRALCGTAEISGVTKHKGLQVVHLGPHLAGSQAPSKAHLDAVASALKAKPQVVVLQEALGASTGWAEVFHGLIRSSVLQSFGGAIVLWCKDETFAARRVCNQRVFIVNEHFLAQEEITSRHLEIVENALSAVSQEDLDEGVKGRKKVCRKERCGEGGDLERLLEEARDLGEYCFEEDLMVCARQESWTVTLLVELAGDGSRTLRGYMCHRLSAGSSPRFYIERLAVPPKARGHGCARHLLRWAEEEALRSPGGPCSSITCSALDTVVPFYEKLGFVRVLSDGYTVRVGDENQDPQTVMERRLAVPFALDSA